MTKHSVVEFCKALHFDALLATLTGISQGTISAIENRRVNLGMERAKTLATALKCHPAVLVFPDWEEPLEVAA
jgi:hypothetical protein